VKPQVPVELHPEAIDEATAARRWYAERSPAAAQAFQTELDRAVLAIGEAPSRWVYHVANTRRFVLQRFPFSVVYFELPNSVLVLAPSRTATGALATGGPGCQRRRPKVRTCSWITV